MSSMSSPVRSRQFTQTQVTPYLSASSALSACAASESGSALLRTSTKGLPMAFSSATTRSSAGT